MNLNTLIFAKHCMAFWTAHCWEEAEAAKELRPIYCRARWVMAYDRAQHTLHRLSSGIKEQS